MRQIYPNQKHAICGKNTLFFFRVCGYMCVCVCVFSALGQQMSVMCW